MPPNIGKMPQNQIDALPLLSADAVSDPGDTVVIGSQLIRHWTPARVGINGASRTAYVNMPTRSATPLGLPLDFSGMNSFTFSISRQVNSAAADTTATPFLRASPISVGQSPLPRDTADALTGLGRLGEVVSDFGSFTLRGAFPYTAYGYRGCSNSAQIFGSVRGTITGPGWFFWLDFATLSGDSANELWSLDIWAQS